MCDVSKKMLATLRTCTLYPRSDRVFTQAAARRDCDTMWHWYMHCVEDRKEVGRGIAQSGRRPLENLRPEMERLYAEHLKSSRADANSSGPPPQKP